MTRSNPISPDPRVESAATCLQSAGYLCMALGWARQFKEKRELPSGRLPIRRIYFPGQFGGGFANILGLFMFDLWLFFQHLKVRPKIIHAFDLDTVLPALLASLILKNFVVYDIADWYADSRRVGFLRPVIENLERWACNKADLVVLPHEDRLQQLGFTPPKLVIYYNSPSEVEALCANTGSHPSGTYFAYVGVLQRDRGIPQMIEAALSANVMLIIAGFGPLSDYCKEAASKEPGIIFCGKVSYGKALEIEGNALAILALYSPALRNNHFAAPNKLYEAMMLRRSLVTTNGISLGRFVESEGIGVAVPYGDIKELASVLTLLVSDQAKCEEMGKKARQLYETKYSFSKQCTRLLTAYEQLGKS